MLGAVLVPMFLELAGQNLGHDFVFDGTLLQCRERQVGSICMLIK